MADDIDDWKRRLSRSERELLTQLLRFFTQADSDIARGYREKYINRFPHPELTMMFFAIGGQEANHMHAYSTLIDTLGIPESEYVAFQSYEAMRHKHEYMFERDTGKGIADLAVDIAVFSAFGEGMQLFSSFALLMSFQKRGLMKGMTTIVEWSIRDETFHVECMIKLFHELIKEHPRVWNDETKKRVYETCRRMVELEDAFIDQATSFGPVEGFTADEAKQYIRYVADRRLQQLGLKPNYDVEINPFEWLDELMALQTHTNFFEQRSTEYSKNEMPFTDGAYDFACAMPEGVLIEAADTTYRVISIPDCPHCERAKALLTERCLAFEVEVLTDKVARDIAKIAWAWGTFPIISRSGRLVGGADALAKELSVP